MTVRVTEQPHFTVMETYVKVKPGADEFRIELGDHPVIHLEEEPENGRANTELLERLKKILGEKPGIVSGHKSRMKKLKIPMNREEFREKIEDYNGKNRS